MRRPVKWALRGLASLLLLVLLSGLALVVTFTTESGSRWAVNRLTGMLTGELSIPEFRGNLWSGMQLQSLVYRDTGLELQAANLDIQVSWASVATGRIVFRTLHAEHVLVRSRIPPDETPQAVELNLEPLSFFLGVDDGRVAHLQTEGYGEARDFREIRVTGLALHDDQARLATGSVTLTETRISVWLDEFTAGTSGDIPLSANLRWHLPDQDWSGQGAVSGNLARLVFEQDVTGPYPLALAGSVAILGQFQPEFDVNVKVEEWPLGDLTLSSATARLQGTFDGYRASYELGVRWPEFPAIRVSGSGSGNLESLAEIRATLETGSATARLEGRLNWLPEFTADLGVWVSAFDPAVLFETASGRLDGQSQLVVRNTDECSFNNTRISGVLNAVAIEASGSVQVSPAEVLCHHCIVVSGPNRVDIHGITGPDQLAFDLSLNAPAIGSLWPALQGSALAGGRVEGNFNLPVFSGELLAENLAFEGWSAGRLQVASTGSGITGVSLSLTGEQLAFEDMVLGTIEASAQGNPDQLMIDASWSFQDKVLTAAGELKSGKDSISGRVRTADLLDPVSGDWRLTAPIDFTYRQGGLSVKPHQWRGATGIFGVNRFESAHGDIVMVASLSGIPLQLANPFLPAAYQLNGTAAAELDLQYTAGTWNGTADYRQHNTVLSLLESNGRQSDVRIPRVNLQARLDNGGADVIAQVAVDPGVSGELRLKLDRLAVDANLQAELQLEGRQWGWISALAPEIDKFEGSLLANFQADGPLQSPQLKGALELRDGSLAIPALNVPINDIRLDLVGAPGGGATLSASATAGGHPLKLDGRIEHLLSEHRAIELQLTGRSAELFNWPEYHVWASPDIRITGDASGWNLEGELGIPMAEVNIRELPVGAVEISPDVRVMGEQAGAHKATQYSGNVAVTLGENVHIVALGLDTRLTGGLQVGIYRDRPVSGIGQVLLEEGTFSAYGRKLTISGGTLNFTGPLDNPLVDVRAMREIESPGTKVIAGIHLTGRAQNLSSVLYSEPAMSEADALSYLVLGRPLSQASLAEGNDLSAAAIALGLGQASRITEQIGRTLGLDQLALAGDGGESTELVAGKQINSRLYARYAYGVFSRIGTLLLRYRLSRYLTLETAAGEAQTIELLYTVEKP